MRDASRTETVTLPSVEPGAGLRRGADGPDVADVQRRLGRLRIDEVTVSGHFDERTERAVRQFQRLRGLPADGVVTDETWRVLVEAG